MRLAKRIFIFEKCASGRSFQFGKYYFTVWNYKSWLVKPNWPVRTTYSFRIWTGIKVEEND